MKNHPLDQPAYVLHSDNTPGILMLDGNRPRIVFAVPADLGADRWKLILHMAAVGPMGIQIVHQAGHTWVVFARAPIASRKGRNLGRNAMQALLEPSEACINGDPDFLASTLMQIATMMTREVPEAIPLDGPTLYASARDYWPVGLIPPNEATIAVPSSKNRELLLAQPLAEKAPPSYAEAGVAHVRGSIAESTSATFMLDLRTLDDYADLLSCMCENPSHRFSLIASAPINRAALIKQLDQSIAKLGNNDASRMSLEKLRAETAGSYKDVVAVQASISCQIDPKWPVEQIPFVEAEIQEEYRFSSAPKLVHGRFTKDAYVSSLPIADPRMHSQAPICLLSSEDLASIVCGHAPDAN